MATEYYIVKPETKQVFYLGKRISYLDGICEFSRTNEAKYPTWECYEDVVFDIQENAKYFLQGWSDITVGQVWDFCSQIWDFCEGKVYLDNDCSDNHKVWKDWEEIDYLSDLLSPEEKWCELVNLVPKEYWITKQEDGINILYEFETVQNYLSIIKQKENK